ncbi:hypothetical protein [Mesobacillus maritimus]|uniref:hypothetical protein n=1 Tax=Mesobacillus maritimus TaxID=1643336 RepID=UPI00384D5410
MCKKVRLLIGMISCLVLFVFGVYNVMNGNLSFAPIILGISGLVGVFGGIYEFKRRLVK